MTYDQLLHRLGECKGTGTWQKLADHSGVHYATIAKLYQKRLLNPGIQTIAKLAAAFEHLEKPRVKRKSRAH